MFVRSDDSVGAIDFDAGGETSADTTNEAI